MEYENDEDEFLENAERQAKRTYLREEILDKGFSAQDFTAFCEQERGADADLWAFDELQDCVKRFKAAVEDREKQAVQKLRGRSPSPSSPRAISPNPIPIKESPVEEEQRPVLVEVQDSPLDEERHTQPIISPRSPQIVPVQLLMTTNLPTDIVTSEDVSPLRLFPSADKPPLPSIPPLISSDPAPFLSSPGYSIASKQLPDTPLSASSSLLQVQIEK